MKETILELENLSVGFKKTILENITAHIQTGSLTVLMGVNGAGKSCLLKTIGHLIPSKHGHIKLIKKELRDYSSFEFAQIVSLVLTEKIQVDFLRVDELVGLGRSPYTNWLGTLGVEDKKIVLNVMKQVGIEHLAKRFFSELSDGQKQKVLIARALAQQPKLLILDEPTTYLDIPSKIELIKLLKKTAIENNIAVLLSTHDLDLIESSADQIWLVGSDGSFTQGSPESLRSTGLFKKHFNLN